MIHSFRFRRALWAASVLPALALAQDPPRASDPGASVPVLPYRSVLAGTASGVETGSADWRQANAEVGRFPRGHADILRWEQARQAGQPAASPPAPHHPMHPPARTAPERGGRP